MDSTATRDGRSSLAFDHLAPSYDQIEADNPILQWMRQRVRKTTLQAFEGAEKILEVGCGTGTDAVDLAQHGHSVTAFDPSAGMLRVAREKARRFQVSENCQFGQADAIHLPGPDEIGRFDGLLSNFGALNCVRDLRTFVLQASALLRPGAQVVLCLMPPVCPWEIVYHTMSARLDQAMRRLHRRDGVAANVEGHLVETFYFSPKELISVFSSRFELEQQYSLGLFIPPPYLSQIASYRRLFKSLAALETRTAGWWPLKNCGDHIVFRFRRT